MNQEDKIDNWFYTLVFNLVDNLCYIGDYQRKIIYTENWWRFYRRYSLSIQEDLENELREI